MAEAEHIFWQNFQNLSMLRETKFNWEEDAQQQQQISFKILLESTFAHMCQKGWEKTHSWQQRQSMIVSNCHKTSALGSHRRSDHSLLGDRVSLGWHGKIIYCFERTTVGREGVVKTSFFCFLLFDLEAFKMYKNTIQLFNLCCLSVCNSVYNSDVHVYGNDLY